MEMAVSSDPNPKNAIGDLKINLAEPEFSTLAPVIGNVRSVNQLRSDPPLIDI